MVKTNPSCGEEFGVGNFSRVSATTRHWSLVTIFQYCPLCELLVLVAVPRPVAPPAPGVVMPVCTALGLVRVVSHAANAKPTTARIDNRNEFMRSNLYDDSDK